MGRHRLAALALIAAIPIAGPARSDSIEIPLSPDDALRAAGLATDTPTLIRCLEDGIPPDHVPPPTTDERQQQPFLFKRFGYYRSVVTVLGNSKAALAVAALRALQSDHFPPTMEADLEVFVIRNTPSRTSSWENWDRAVRYQRDWLRMDCALALAKITGESPLPFLDELLVAWTPSILEDLSAQADDNQLSRFYVALCRALTVHGAKSGIDAMISILDHPSGVIRFPAVSILQQLTNQNFGPDYDDSDRKKATDVNKWKEWWALNRDTFIADSANIEAPSSRQPPIPAAVTLRDRVWHAQKASMDYGGRYLGRQSIEWLEANGAHELRGLRQIAEDENAQLAIRAEALKWFVKFKRNPSYEMLLGYVNRPPLPHFDALSTTALDLIKDRFPDRYQEACKFVLSNKPDNASNAVHALAETPEGVAYLAEHFSSLQGETKFQAIQVLIASETLSISVLEDALLGDDLLVAVFAALGAKKSGLEARLSLAARSALARWRTDPEFLIYRINNGADDEATVQDFENVFKAIGPADPRAAMIYIRTRDSLQDRERYNPHLQADLLGVERINSEALRGFLRCLEAYRASRGLSQPLPNYTLN